MKLDPRLPQLPSIGELLEHPRVRAVVGRINRSTLAQRATGFLDELRTTLVERAGRWETPSVTQLAERLVRRLLGEPSSEGPAINATGLVVGDPVWAPPLAERAIERIVQCASEYAPRAAEATAAAERALCEAAGVEAALLLDDFSAACRAAEAAAAGEGIAVVREALAGIANPSRYGLVDVPTLSDRIAGGAPLVVVDGSGLLGGPACGVVCGQRKLVEHARTHAASGGAAASSMTAVALRATFELVREQGDDWPLFVPTWQLLSAPLANLQQRAERLAMLAAAASGVTLAEARPIESMWGASEGLQLTGPSWEVALRPVEGDLQSLAAQLAEGPYPILARVAHDAVELDLRSVFSEVGSAAGERRRVNRRQPSNTEPVVAVYWVFYAAASDLADGMGRRYDSHTLRSHDRDGGGRLRSRLAAATCVTFLPAARTAAPCRPWQSPRVLCHILVLGCESSHVRSLTRRCDDSHSKN